MISFLFSIVGIISVFKITNRFHQFLIISGAIQRVLSVLLVIPIYFFYFFKEHTVYFTVYIGCLLIILTCERIFFTKKLKKVYFQTRIQIINQIIFMLKAGSSPQKAVFDCLNSLNQLEKCIYSPLSFVYSQKIDDKSVFHQIGRDFNDKLIDVLKKNSHVVDNLAVLKDYIKVENTFYKKLNTINTPIYVQIGVCSVVYLIMMAISIAQFQLANQFGVILVSISLFITGLLLIRYLGKGIKWTV